MYRIGSFVVKHYNEICQYDLEQFIKSSKCSQEEVQDFFYHLGFHSYEEFSSTAYH
mgnify:CR=1 FL=1